MNNNTSTFISLGAIGTLIAYFGYQYLDENDDDDHDNQKKSTDKNELLYNDETKDGNLGKEMKVKKNDTSQQVLEDTSSNSITDISSNTIKLEVTAQINQKHKEKKEIIDNKLETPKNKWSNYWEDQYKNIDKKQEITVE